MALKYYLVTVLLLCASTDHCNSLSCYCTPKEDGLAGERKIFNSRLSDTVPGGYTVAGSDSMALACTSNGYCTLPDDTPGHPHAAVCLAISGTFGEGYYEAKGCGYASRSIIDGGLTGFSIAIDQGKKIERHLKICASDNCNSASTGHVSIVITLAAGFMSILSKIMY